MGRRAASPGQSLARGGAPSATIGVLLLGLLTPGTASESYWTLPIPAQGEPPAGFIDPVKDISAASCGLCHPRQYSEWRDSLHARAAGKGLLGQVLAFDPETAAACLTCHAPRAEQQAAILSGQAGTRSTGGVDCASCHLRAHRRHGPRPKTITPHGPVVETPLFRSSDFCAPCHQFPEGTGELNGKPLEDSHREWAGSAFGKAGISCQDCHMHEGSHGFGGIHDRETTRNALTLVVRRHAAGVELTARNAGAGHALPTYATPRITLSLASRESPTHRVERTLQRHLDWDTQAGLSERSDTRLMPGETLHLRLALQAEETAFAEVRVEPDAFYHEVVYPTLLAAPETQQSPELRAWLEDAQRATGTTGYLLYHATCPPWRGVLTPCDMRWDEIAITGGIDIRAGSDKVRRSDE